MSEFKVGDVVTIPTDCIDHDYNTVGDVVRIDEDGDFIVSPRGHPNKECYGHDYKLISRGRTMDNLEVGDVLIQDDCEYTVQAVIDRLVFLSEYDDPEVSGGHYTVSELKEGFKLKTEETVKEMTVQEVSELVGKTVKIVE